MTTIRQQLTRKLLLASAGLIAIGGAAIYLCTRAALQAQFDAVLHAKAHTLTTLTEKKGARIEMDILDKQMPSFDPGGSDFFELRQMDGEMVEHSRSLGEAHLPHRHEIPTAPVFCNVMIPGGRPGRAIELKFQPQIADDSPQGTAVSDALLMVASDRRDLDGTLVTLQLVLAGCGALLLAGVALAVPRLLRREMAPLPGLADHAARIDAGSLSARFPTSHLPGELAPITARLNELLARLEDSFERERRFSSNVAHEFRTPIAELRSLAELAIKLPDTRTASTDREVLTVALHLQSVLDHLLALARGERNDLPLQHERMTLEPLVEEVCRRFQDKAAARQIAFHWQVPAGLEIHSDPVLLRSILMNLVDNAVEYTPHGGAVELEASVNLGCFQVRILNPVDNLDERDLPHLFDRFWRKDAARSPDGHTGLGLSLARVFAHSLGCELTASFAGPARLAMTLAQIKALPSSKKGTGKTTDGHG